MKLIDNPSLVYTSAILLPPIKENKSLSNGSLKNIWLNHKKEKKW